MRDALLDTLQQIGLIFLIGLCLVGVLFMCSQLGCQKPSATINSGGGDATLRQQTAAAVIESPELEKLIDAKLSAIVQTTVTAEVKNQLTAELTSIIKAEVKAQVGLINVGGNYNSTWIVIALIAVIAGDKIGRRFHWYRKIDDKLKSKPKAVKFAGGE